MKRLLRFVFCGLAMTSWADVPAMQDSSSKAVDEKQLAPAKPETASVLSEFPTPRHQIPEITTRSIALVEFDTLNAIGTPKAGQVLPNLMTSSLRNVGNWKIADRIVLKKVLEEQALQTALLDRDEEAVELGRIQGAQLILTGSVLKVGRNHVVTARLVDVMTGVVLASQTVSFQKPEDLQEAAERLAWKIMGYSDRQIHTEWTRRNLRQMRVGVAVGSGWSHTRTEEWVQDMSQSRSERYRKDEENAYGGVALDLTLQMYSLDFGLFGILPKRVGLLGTYGNWYPTTHFGFGLAALQTQAVIKDNSVEQGWMEWTTPVLLLALRPADNFRISLGKGRSASGEIRSRSRDRSAPALPIETRLDWFQGPTFAQFEYRFPMSTWTISGRYFHALEKSDLRVDSERQVIGLQRWLTLSVGGSLGL